MSIYQGNRRVQRWSAGLGFAAGTLALSAPLMAQQGGLEEITVTARFREENLQQTPLAITAFSGENMEARNLTDVTMIDTFSPNTIIAPLGAGWGSTAAAFIRGIGLGDNSLSFEPGVPIYIDDVYHGRPQGAILDLLDLERVEILRGPQGTLFGKNAIGGTIRLVSRKPQGDDTGEAEVKFGSYDRIDLRGSYDIALVPDKVFARFSASSTCTASSARRTSAPRRDASSISSATRTSRRAARRSAGSRARTSTSTSSPTSRRWTSKARRTSTRS
jgi:outer membrane receptor protein involved in Fe transport